MPRLVGEAGELQAQPAALVTESDPHLLTEHKTAFVELLSEVVRSEVPRSMGRFSRGRKSLCRSGISPPWLRREAPGDRGGKGCDGTLQRPAHYGQPAQATLQSKAIHP